MFGVMHLSTLTAVHALAMHLDVGSVIEPSLSLHFEYALASSPIELCFFLLLVTRYTVKCVRTSCASLSSCASFGEWLVLVRLVRLYVLNTHVTIYYHMHVVNLTISYMQCLVVHIHRPTMFA